LFALLFDLLGYLGKWLPNIGCPLLDPDSVARGGSAESRTRIVLEILDALIAVWGPGRFVMGGFGPMEQTIAEHRDVLPQRGHVRSFVR
jgi:hypothetical protein